MRVVVVGGAGLLGGLVTEELRVSGHDVVAASRRTGVDAANGQGLRRTFAGADAVVDCSDLVTLSARRAIAFSSATARNICRAAITADVPHVVAVSIVGCTRPQVQGLGYYRGKAARETVLAAYDAPVTIVRTTQWFELADRFLRARLGPVSLVPHMRSQPVAAHTAAQLVADAVEHGFEADAVRELAGPAEHDLADLAKRIAAREHPRRKVLAITYPGAGPAIAAGVLLPGPTATVAGPTFDEWLAARPRP